MRLRDTIGTERPRSSTRRLAGALVLSLAVAVPAAGQRAADPLPTPVLVTSGRYDIALLTHASAQGLSDQRRGAEWFRACRTHLIIPASDSLAVIRSQPWDWTSGAVTDPSTITVLVSRTPRLPVDCAASPAATAIAYGRGFRVTADTAYPYDATITEVIVRRGETVLLARDIERVAATRLTIRGLITVTGALLRISLPADSLAPDASGRVDDLELEIISPDSALPHRVAIPWTSLRPLWEQLLRARAAGRSAALATEVAAPLAALAATEAPDERRLDARIRAGDAFARAGDLPAARVLLASAVQEEPCLTLAPTMDGASRDVVATVDRPRARCVANLPLVVGRATLLPGFGRLDGTPRRVYAAAVMATVVGVLAASQSSNDEAKRLYARYLAVDDPNPITAATLAGGLYDDAESKRLLGRNLVVAGATLWGASIVEAALAETRLIARLSRVRDYSTSRRMSVVPIASPDRVGLSLTVF